MWTYIQKTGALIKPDGSVLAVGYSGRGPFKNNPASQNLIAVGPIPQGLYYIGKPVDTVTHGPYVLPLTPSPDNVMYGRSGFLIHGDSIVDPGNASEGCIVQPLYVREAIGMSDDLVLSVQSGA